MYESHSTDQIQVEEKLQDSHSHPSSDFVKGRGIPAYTWSRRLDEEEPSRHIHTFSRPPILEALSLLPVASRVGRYLREQKHLKKEPIFDLNGIALEPPNPGPYGGVPIGGLGGGNIGVGYRGDFRRWSLYPGRYEHNVVYSNQFLIWCKRRDVIETAILQSYDEDDEGNAIRGVPSENIHYHGLYPRAWRVFHNAVSNIDVTIVQLSPIIPKNYSDSSLPVCVFEIDVKNTGIEDVEVSIMQIFENNPGAKHGNSLHETLLEDGNFHIPFDISASQKVTGICQSRPCISRCVSEAAGDEATGVNQSFLGMLSCPPIFSSNNVREDVHIDQGSFALATLCGESNTLNITRCNQFYSSGDYQDFVEDEMTVERIYAYFAAHGQLPDSSSSQKSDPQILPTPNGLFTSSAICVKKFIQRDEKVTFSFSLAWDNPIVRFGNGRPYSRYYTQFVGTSGFASPALAAYALLHKDEWHHKISSWQRHVQSDDSLPDYYKHLVFNELYFLSDGGCVWLHEEHTVNQLNYDAKEEMVMREMSEQTLARIQMRMMEHLSNVILTKIVKQMESSTHPQSLSQQDLRVKQSHGEKDIVGRFLYLEGQEYLMYNTYDVHFYASFALLMLWPQLELSIQRDFAAAISSEDHTGRVMLGSGELRPRKVKGAIPHDLGSPSEDPFYKTNIYNFQDVSRWKDLGTKFALQIYRDFLFHNFSMPFLTAVYPSVIQAMEFMHQFDTNGDGMIENGGFPDQTYDIWTASGVSAYCGGLWLAACLATSRMAEVMSDEVNRIKYSELYDKGSVVYEKLWNGLYYNYDDSQSSHRDSIMADMLAGHWYTLVFDALEANVITKPRERKSFVGVVTPEKALSCLQTIFKYNVEMFGNGEYIGAVNGMRPNPSGHQDIDHTCLQSREVWTGTTYALASTMILQSDHLPQQETSSTSGNLVDMAMKTAQGIHDGGWVKFGYWYATPEAWEQSGNYRSLSYMRPLSIWAIQFALDHVKNNKKEKDDVIVDNA